MSGPIVRRYGFPNFEKIFGERDLKHGADEKAEAPAPQQPPADTPKAEPKPGKIQPEGGPTGS